MDAIQHRPDIDLWAHLEEARRVLALPLEVNRLAWHPFGVFAVPLPPRRAEGETWSRRLHVWHPETTPVGETSIYGVHTHSGTGLSHVLTGTLQHHLYAFAPDDDGVWLESSRTGRRHTSLLGHVQAPTTAGQTHILPANHPHGVSKPPGFAVSLFEQREEGRAMPFTTWQRLDAPAEELVLTAPLDPYDVLVETRRRIEEALFAAEAKGLAPDAR